MVNKWMMHVKKTMKKMSGQKKSMGKGWFKSVLKAAKSSYKKHGGAEPADEPHVDTATEPSLASISAAVGGRRRKTRKNRRRHH